jgi:putative PIN family toxin of toxin-antitoxin system
VSSKKPRIVLDTNVLYAGLYSSKGASFKVLQALERGSLQTALSTALLFEYEEVLKRNREILNLSEGAIEHLLDSLCSRSEHHKIHFLWRPRLPDAGDDHVLELAVASGAEWIVTHNKKDFIGTSDLGVRAISPKELLGKLK